MTTTQTTTPSIGYDRELIAAMLDDLLRAEAVSEDLMTYDGRSHFSTDAIAEQKRLLCEADDRDAAGVRKVYRSGGLLCRS